MVLLSARASTGEEKWTAKVIDFGLARSLAPDPADYDPALVTTGFLGTALYAAPEQCEERGDLDGEEAPAPSGAAQPVVHRPPESTGTMPLRMPPWFSMRLVKVVLPMAPIMRVPVASSHLRLMLSPVWQPQLFT